MPATWTFDAYGGSALTPDALRIMLNQARLPAQLEEPNTSPRLRFRDEGLAMDLEVDNGFVTTARMQVTIAEGPVADRVAELLESLRWEQVD